MKCKTIKFLTAGAASLAAALLCAGLANAGAKIGVFAETAQGEQNETPYTTGETIASFKLDEKASVRKTDNPGIRFATQISAADKIAGAEYGTLVIPKHLLGENELTLENANAQKIVTKIWLNEEETAYYSALTGIDEKYYNTPLIARSYMKTAENVVHYTNIAERSLGYVAVMALDGGEESNLIEGIAAKTEDKFDLSATALKLNTDKTEETLTATASVGGIAYTPEITWASSAENVASVDNNGALQALKEGEATITAKFTLNGKEKSAECKVTVKDEIELVISGGGDVYLNSADGEKTRTLSVDTFTVNGEARDASLLTWATSDETLATVSGATVTGVKGGKVKISAEYTSDLGSKVSASQEVIVVTRVLTQAFADQFGSGASGRWGEISLFYGYMNATPDGYFILKNDITFADDKAYLGGTNGGTTVSSSALNNYHAAVGQFSGTLDGRGYSLNNVGIKYKATDNGNTAIFGNLTGEIKDLFVELVDKTESTMNVNAGVGLVFHITGNGKVSNVALQYRIRSYSIGSEAKFAQGGICLMARDNAAIENCIVNVTAEDSSAEPSVYLAGILGADWHSDKHKELIKNNYVISEKIARVTGWTAQCSDPEADRCFTDGAAFFAGVTALNETDGWCKYWKIENGTLKFGNNVLISSEPSAE